MSNVLKRLRRRNSGSPKESLPRLSSLPFVSGDTFRNVAEVVLETDETSIHRGLGTGIVFADAKTVKAPNFRNRLQESQELLSGDIRGLVIHNGDHTFSVGELTSLSVIAPHVWSSNLSETTHNITPVPIGLENAYLDKNGRLDDFLNALTEPIKSDERTRYVLSTFHESTNAEIRSPLANVMRSSRFGHEEIFRRRADYRNEVRHTKFVISPPGNGMDCHRTWEAVYLGAVPVVLKGFLAESLTSDLPIHVVERYEDFVSLNDSELDDLYDDLRSRPLTKAWGHYWLGQILG